MFRRKFKITRITLVIVFTLGMAISTLSYAEAKVRSNFSAEMFISKTAEPIKQPGVFSFQVGEGAMAENQEKESESKISSYVLEKLKEVGPDAPIEVIVGISDQYNLQDFISNQSILKENTITISSTHTFVANLTEDQIVKMGQYKEVFWISLSSEISTSAESALSGDDIQPYLNASTEMTGTKKARKDFGVTGAGVVIAVIDTGIDADHVDLSGKIVGWKDYVNNKVTAYDDNGHGTHVASIAAGKGVGDPGIQEGYAPGANLVGVKTLNNSGSGTISNLANAINWIIDNNNSLKVKIINISQQTYNADVTPVCNAITRAKNVGIVTTIAAGNFDSDPNKPKAQYNSLSEYAKCDGVIVGNMVDPYEGGWYPNETSRRGTAKGSTTTGPSLMAPGTNIRAAAANTKNEYAIKSGTSMSTPAVSGIIALMNEASKGSVNYNFYTEHYGPSGFNPIYGHGEILAYDSIKAAIGSSSGSFDDYRDHLLGQDVISQGYIHTYRIEVYNTDPNLYFATTLLMLDEDSDDFDLYLWGPGKDPQIDNPDYSSIGTDPQEVITFKPTSKGIYTVGVHAYGGSGQYSIDFIGQIRPGR